MTSAQYGHMIKHLEIGHLEALPFVSMPAGYEERFNQAFDKIIQLRNRSHEQTEKAERLFEKNFGKYSSKLSDKVGFSVSASSALAGQRRRFEAQFHNPDVRELVRHLSGSAISWDSIKACGHLAKGNFARGKIDHCSVALICLFVASSDAPECFEIAEEVFDEMPPAVGMEIAIDLPFSV